MNALSLLPDEVICIHIIQAMLNQREDLVLLKSHWSNNTPEWQNYYSKSDLGQLMIEVQDRGITRQQIEEIASRIRVVQM